MICPQCKAEYRTGFTVCADCEIDLVDSLEEYLRTAKPEERAALVAGPVRLEPFHRTARPEELAELLEELEVEAVPYVVQAGTALAMLAGQELDPSGQPDPWEARIAVLSSHLPRARQVLVRVQQARTGGTGTVLG